MKWKLGLGLACIACCAIPLIGIGSAALGGAGLAAWSGISSDVIVCGLGLLVMASALGWWLRRGGANRECAACPADGSCGCK